MNRFRWALVRFLAAVACASPFAVFLALPMFDYGLYRQVDTVAVGLHATAALVAMALLLLSLTHAETVARSVTPPVLALLAICFLGALTSPFADLPARSFYGTLEHGVGLVWYAEVATLTVAFGVAWSEAPGARPYVALASMLSVACCATLQVLHRDWHGSTLAPYDFPEYLGLNAMIASAPAFALRRRWATILALAFLATCGALSGNRGVAVAFVAAVVLVAALALPRSRALLGDRIPGLSVVATLAVALVVVLAAPTLQTLALSSADPSSSPLVASAAPIDHVAIASKPYGTLWQRSTSARIVALDLAEHPIELLTGRGFGSFDTVAETQGRSVPGRRMVTPQPTASRAYWDGDQKAKFHSHNQVVESLLSCGVFGLVAWLAFVWTVARMVRPGAYGAVALLAVVAVGTGLWFLVNATAPLLALALASISPETNKRVGPDRRTLSPALTSAVTLSCSALCVSLAAVTAFSFTAIKGERVERYFVPLPVLTCAGYSAFTLPNRDINRQLYVTLVRRILDKGQAAVTEVEKERFNLVNYSCLMHSYAERDDVMALMASLRGRYELSKALGLSDPLLPSLLKTDFDGWGSDVERLLRLSPGRTDFLVPYVAWLQANKRTDQVTAAVDEFEPTLRGGDPVKAWLAAQRSQAQGDGLHWSDQMRTAMREGFANLFPVPTDVTAKLLLR